MQLKIGPLDINAFEPSGWIYDTSHGLDGSLGFFKAIFGGGGAGRLTVKQQRPNLPNTGKRYRMSYAQVFVGVGTPWPIPVSASGSREEFPSGSTFGWPVFRMPGSPDASGEGGPPTGFLGAFSMTTISANPAFAGGSAAVLLMGAIEFLWQPVAYKYFTIITGTTVSSAISASVTGARGVFLDIVERSD